jgi:hypothetical protein
MACVCWQWWRLTSDDPEDRTYEEEKPTAEDIAAHGIETSEGVYFIVNSTELRLAGFAMDPVIPLAAATPVAQRTRGSSAAPERPSTAGRRFVLPADIENQILALCW